MRNVIVRTAAAIVVALGVAPGTASASEAPASCVGQEVSVLATTLGGDLGAAVSFEARHPELEGRRNFGAEISGLAHADRSACPEEG